MTTRISRHALHATAAAYRALTEGLKYCQCWDEKGWFWKPAEAAESRARRCRGR
jgi:hypothetical protein